MEKVRRTTTPSWMRPAAVSPAYSKYASSTTSGRAAGSGPKPPVGLFGRQQNVTAGDVVTDLGSGDVRGNTEDWVRRCLRDRDGVAGARKRARAQHDEVVRARAENDVLRLDARVPRDARYELRKPAVRVLVRASERSRDRARPCGRRRRCRHVPVEAHDLDRIEADLGGDLVRRRRPAVLRELGGKRSHRRTASACADMPSAAASASTVGRSAASPSAVRRWVVIGFRNVSSPIPPTARAQPPVGSTWFPPVA